VENERAADFHPSRVIALFVRPGPLNCWMVPAADPALEAVGVPWVAMAATWGELQEHIVNFSPKTDVWTVSSCYTLYAEPD
jgi:hypothetical protein